MPAAPARNNAARDMRIYDSRVRQKCMDEAIAAVQKEVHALCKTDMLIFVKSSNDEFL